MECNLRNFTDKTTKPVLLVVSMHVMMVYGRICGSQRIQS